MYHALVKTMDNFGTFMAGELETFLNECGLDRDKLLGVGIALPAVLSRSTGRITWPRPWISGTPPCRSWWGAYLIRLTWTTTPPAAATPNGSPTADSGIWPICCWRPAGGAVLVNGGQYQGDNYRSGEFGQ